ncbi:MAG: HEAT repeat domain-containing protein [Euryarchaeota archaeon]|nr:HEAT repeat domain-containing protein [Euryarchaeota archaeon]
MNDFRHRSASVVSTDATLVAQALRTLLTSLAMLTLLTLFVLPCAGDANSNDENIVIVAADTERVLLDYSIDTLDVVSMAAENYYVVAYKNIVCGRGIVVFTSNGTVVDDASTVKSVVGAVAWRQAANQLTIADIDTVKALVGSPQAIETNRVNLITSYDSLAVLGNDLNQTGTTDYGVISAFAERAMSVDQNMDDILNGTEFFLKDLAKQENIVAGVVKNANSTRESLQKDWEGRQHAQTQVMLTLVLIAVIIVAVAALLLIKSKKKDFSIKKRAYTLIGKKKENIIDQLHSPDADERARSALMAGAFADLDESVIPHIIVLLDDPDERVRANAAQSIRRIGQRDKSLVQFAKDPLKRHLDDPSDKVRDAVSQAYQVVGGTVSAATEKEFEVEASKQAETTETTEAVAEETKGTENPPPDPEEPVKTVVVAKATLTDAQQKRLHELRQSVNQSINDLPAGCDLCIPYYLRGICTTITDMIEHAHSGDGDAIDEMIDAAGRVCSYIADLVENGRFIDICISSNMGAFDDTGFVLGVEEYQDGLDALIRDPVSFVDSSHVEEELWELDSTITKKMSELTIIPISGLWKVSKNIFDDAADESGIKHAFSILIATIILKRTRGMMENPEIVRRLQL